MRHRFILLCLSSLLAVYLGFIHFDVDHAFSVVGRFGYWFILGGFLLALRTAFVLLRKCWLSRLSEGRRLLVSKSGKAQYLLPVLAIAASWGYFQNAQPREFKIHMDEPVLAATAKQMHLDRTCFYFTGGYNIQNMYYPHSGAVDKRPFFYPLLVSLLHDTTGYRVENSFYANSIILLVFLAVAYHLGARMLPPLGGYLSLVILLTLPLLPVVSNSGGFDLLNVTMIGLTLVALFKYIDTPNLENQGLLVAISVLLVQSRYESAVFVIAVVVSVLWHWWQARRIEVSWALIVTPLLLVPFALQRVMMGQYSSFWQMQEGRTEPFSFSYLNDNLQHAGVFFFSSSGELPNSLLLTILSILSVFFILWGAAIGRWSRCFTNSVKWRMACVIALLVFFNFALLMVYHWAHLDDLAVTRIALPFMCLQVALVLLALKLMFVGSRFMIGHQLLMILVVFFYFATVSRPAMALTKYVPVLESESLSDRLLELAEDIQGEPLSGSPLLISEVSIIGVLANISSIPANTAVRKLPQLDLHMRYKTFDEVFVLYLVGEGFLESNPAQKGPLMFERIENSFILSGLEERATPSGKIMRLARVVGIRSQALPASEALRPDWGSVEIDYTGKMSNEELKNLQFVETLPK